MHNLVKKRAHDFCKKYKLQEPTYKVMSDIAQMIGFTVIEFNYIYNDEPVAILIEKLNLSEDIIRTKGFTYADSHHRLIFINEDLSDEEKLMVMTHEMGHIVCGHFSHSNIIGLDVQEEHEANEFTHYVLKPRLVEKASRYVNAHRLVAAIVAAVIIILLLGSVIFYNMQKEKRYYGEYYITESGQKYHEEGCIFVKDKDNVHRMTTDEYESGDYEPCQICLPN